MAHVQSAAWEHKADRSDDFEARYPEFIAKATEMRRSKMKDRQAPLYARYAEEPEAAVITDAARTSCRSVPASSPIHTELSIGVENPVSVPVGVHRAVGGDSDFPNPGDVLCGALASCLDTTIRIVANRVGVRLKELQVEVTATVDVRGTLRAEKGVPVAFQRFDVAVTLVPKGFVPGVLLNKLLEAAEYSCVVLQSLRGQPTVTVMRR